MTIARWIAAAVRKRGTIEVPAAQNATPNAALAPAPPADHERIAQVGDALQSCYPDRDETLDGNLTSLMLHLTVEPPFPPGPRKR